MKILKVKNAISVDTTMGFTPLEGLAMGTRSGSIDSSIVPFLAQELNLTAYEALNILNKKSGVLGGSGVSSDFRDIMAATEGGDERVKLALDIFIIKVRKYIGVYAAAMGGVDYKGY